MRELDGQHGAPRPQHPQPQTPRQARHQPHNLLLRSLPAGDAEAVMRASELVTLRPRQIVHHWNMDMEHAYFIESGLVSAFARLDREKSVEVWHTGADGMIGIPSVLGHADDPTHRRVVQIGGNALRVPIDALRRIADDHAALQLLLTRYALFLLVQASQLGACNSHHRLKQRLARWLLQACDAVGSVEIRLTHALLGRLLGVRRASVTDSLNELEREGLVAANRGAILVQNRDGLDHACCDCYRIVRASRRRLLGTTEVQ
jgi:CRP-like cAMP-binding protein